jgi:hypothetical protein
MKLTRIHLFIKKKNYGMFFLTQKALYMQQQLSLYDEKRE